MTERYIVSPDNGNKEPKKKGTFGKIVLGILVVLGVLFLIIMLLPEDETSSEDIDSEEISRDVEEEESDVDIAEAEPESSSEDTKPKTGSEKLHTSIIRKEGKKTGSGIETVSVGTEDKSATVMVYMNGSDLETEAGEATNDISEMLSSGIGDNVNVIIQTMGTKKWQDYGISSKTAQTYKIEDGDLVLIRDDLGQLDCTAEKTLSEFIGFCRDNYPADRYMFVFWDHGGGPVYGFGFDQWQPEDSSLTLSEMSRAFSKYPDLRFDIIGMDCCIMGNLETCYALAPFCKFALLSEDFESGLGWSYERWMKHFEENPGISTPLLGKYIVDDIIKENEENIQGKPACLALYNESTIKNLFSAWKAYAYKNEEALYDNNYSRKHLAKGRAAKGFWDLWGSDESAVTLSDYYISDILALTESIDNESDEAKSLISSLKAAVAYYGHTSDKNELTGMAVSLPYGDREFYDRLCNVYKDLDFDDEYIDWLGGFVSDSNDYFDYDDFENSWEGWGSYEDEYGCNISSGGSCEYGFDYDSCSDYDEDYEDDWIYDYEEELWYLYEDDMLYLYDEDSDTIYYYDEDEDEVYYYDEEYDDWYLAE